MLDWVAKRGRPISAVLLAVGSMVALVGWALAIFAAGTRCHPNPCPRPDVMYGILAMAFGGTLAFGAGGIGSGWYLLKARREE